MSEETEAIYLPGEDTPELPLPLALPNQPFTEQECMLLLDEVAENFPNPHDALEELMECGSSLFEDVEELMEDYLSEEQFTILVPLLIQIAFVFAPPGTLQPELNLDTMEAALEDLLEDRAQQDEAEVVTECRQPALLKLGLQTLAEFNTHAPKGMIRLQAREMGIVTLLLRVVIDEFDAALRVPGAARTDEPEDA
jgi:hypothetical protein